MYEAGSLGGASHLSANPLLAWVALPLLVSIEAGRKLGPTSSGDGEDSTVKRILKMKG